MRTLHIDELDYDLPPERIAQRPIDARDSARLLVDTNRGEGVADRSVRELPELLDPGDLVVVNDTRVLPARVAVRRPSGGRGEVLLLHEVDATTTGAPGGRPERWEALCRPSARMAPGSQVTSLGGRITFELGEDLGGGRRIVRPQLADSPADRLADSVDGGGLGPDRRGLLDALEADGQMPLPPYITETLEDPERYQTTFAARAASAAAPTAGLHITQRLMEELGRRSVGVAAVELVVGLDTFRPVTTDQVEDHEIHTELYSVPEATWLDVMATRSAGGNVVAVGTTTVRALESAAHTGDLTGRTDLFITPGFDFRVVDRLMTNFHLPRSSLLALVEAFAPGRWRELYAHALESEYRFLSFGDAMLLSRPEVVG